MNSFDVLVIILLILAVFRGRRVGLARLIGSAAGFVVGLYAGSKIASVLHSHTDASSGQAFMLILIIFATAFIVAAIGEAIGAAIRHNVRRIHLGGIDNILGAAFEFVFVLLVVWIVGSALSNVGTGNAGMAIRNSATMRILGNSLPAPPDILSELAQIARANGFPNVFVEREPAPRSPINVDNSAIQTQEVRAAAESVYRIEGIGCGGVVEGSGFAIASNLVATNAHVVAGISRPYVMVGNKPTSATVVSFDKDTDFAVLRVARTDLKPLQVSHAVLPTGTPVAVVGYPSGEALTIGGGAVLDTITAVGRDIYNRGLVQRQIYEVQADVNPGNSGGPLLNAGGQVVGVVFAKSVTSDSVGYALLASTVWTDIQESATATTGVSTGKCAAN